MLPIRYQEVFKLTNLGLSPDLFKFGNLTFESEKYICVKDGAVSCSKAPQIFKHSIQEAVIVDTSKGFAADRKPMKADGILMHKSRNVIALRAMTGDNTVIQVTIFTNLTCRYRSSIQTLSPSSNRSMCLSKQSSGSGSHRPSQELQASPLFTTLTSPTSQPLRKCLTGIDFHSHLLPMQGRPTSQLLNYVVWSGRSGEVVLFSRTLRQRAEEYQRPNATVHGRKETTTAARRLQRVLY